MGQIEAMKRRVLFVTYLFPPVCGAGVQRITTFVKYLPHWGWLPSVLTVTNPSLPLTDGSMMIDIPQNTLICRAPTLEPSYTLKAMVSEGGNGAIRKQGAGRYFKTALRRLA